MKIKLILFCLILFIQGFSQNPEKVNIFKTLQGNINVSSNSAYYEDKTGHMNFEQIESTEFKDFEGQEYNFGFSPSAFWIKFSVKSELPQKNTYVIQLTNWYIDEADLYCRDFTGKLKILKNGDKISLSRKIIKSKYPSFSINLPNESQQTYYIRVKNSQYNNFKIMLYENLDYFKEKAPRESKELILGLIIMRFLFHLSLLFFMFFDKNFRAYSFWGIVLCFVYYFSGGYGVFTFPNSPKLANLAFFFSISFVPGVMSFYIYQIFNIKDHLPQFKWVFIAFAATGGGNLLLNVFFHHAYLSWVFIIFMAFFVIFQLGFSLWVYLRIFKPSFWYISPLIIYLPAFSMYYLRNAGILDLNTDFNIIQMTFFLDFISIPFITGALLKQSKLENIKLENSYFQKNIETEKLQELDTLKTNFFTNISHEFRTPLSLLVAPLSDLSERFPNEWEILIMQKNVGRLQNLINQFLDLTKLEAGKLNVNIVLHDMPTFLKQCLASFESLAHSKSIDFQFIQNLNQKDAYFDMEKTETIINNLLSNAFKFTQKEGRINVNIFYENENVTMTFEDNGIGISPESLSFVFDRFYQVHEGEVSHTYEGTGIGLALVKELVGILKGKITLKSQVGTGTMFTIVLPIDKDTWEQEWKNGVKESPTLKSKNTATFQKRNSPEAATINPDDNILLIVEDNADLRLYIRSVFEQDYQIVEAIDGQEGIEKATALIPDIVISDLMMPRLDGLGFCKLLKSDEKTSHIPVVLLTAKADVESRIEGFGLGADDYLIKPFNKEELQVRVRNLVKQREILRQKYDKQVVDLKPTEVILPSIDEKFIKKAKEVVETHISESEFKIEQFAEEMNLSSVVLRRKIKAVTNQSATQFVRKYRLQKAANLLQNNADTVSNIAYQVGFESLSYFTRAFQEEFGKSPSDYGK